VQSSYIAIEYAAHHPERVCGLVLASTTTNFTGALGAYTRAVGWLLGRVVNEQWQRVQLVRGMRRKYAPEIAEPLIAAGTYPRAAGAGLLDLAGYDAIAALATIDRPILFLNGEDDTACR